ncbi:hypothetical protein ACFSR7_31940 [Cohnella sp. GCM10020058]
MEKAGPDANEASGSFYVGPARKNRNPGRISGEAFAGRGDKAA